MFNEVSRQHKVNIALLPIGAYEPKKYLKKVHMDPVDALQAFTDLKAEIFIPIHWGSFKLSLEPIDEPPRKLREVARKEDLGSKIHILENGKSYKYN